MENITSYAVFGLTILLIVVVASWPSLLVWRLAQSTSYRFSGNGDNMLIVIPTFIVIMLVACLIDAHFVHQLENAGVTDADFKMKLGKVLWGYCICAIALVAVRGVLTLIGSTFSAVNNAIRGD